MRDEERAKTIAENYFEKQRQAFLTYRMWLVQYEQYLRDRECGKDVKYPKIDEYRAAQVSFLTFAVDCGDDLIDHFSDGWGYDEEEHNVA